MWATLWPPVSLTSTATLLERDGHILQVIDFPAIRETLDNLKKRIQSFQPDFAVWNTGTPTLAFDLQPAEIIKRLSPQTITAVLGTHVSAQPEETLNHSAAVDIVVRGEPEVTLQTLCRTTDRQWQSISGISWRDPTNGRIHHNRKASFLPPEAIPRPAWHHLDLRPYRLPLKGRPFLIVAPVRGCPFACRFCTARLYYGRRLRKRPVIRVIDEIQDNIEKYHIRDFFIWADTFTADKSYVRDFCREILQRKLKIAWTCNSRVDTIDPDMLALMQQAGLWMISFGLESGSDTILKRSGKNITVKQSITAVKAAHALGIKTAGHFMFGLPGETRETMEATLRLALSLPLDIAQFYTATPFPGTELYEEARQAGWLAGHTACSQHNAGMSLPGLPAETVNAFRRKAYRRFYCRPGTLLGVASMLEPAGIRPVLLNFKRFFQWSNI